MVGPYQFRNYAKIGGPLTLLSPIYALHVAESPPFMLFNEAFHAGILYSREKSDALNLNRIFWRCIGASAIAIRCKIGRNIPALAKLEIPMRDLHKDHQGLSPEVRADRFSEFRKTPPPKLESCALTGDSPEWPRDRGEKVPGALVPVEIKSAMCHLWRNKST